MVHAARTQSVRDALDALSTEQLRRFVTEALEGLDTNTRAILEDRLLQHANRSSGWKPTPPPTTIATDATTFAAIARREGQAEPSQVEDAGTPSGSACEELARILYSPARGLFDFERAAEIAPSDPKLPNPTLIDTLQRADVMPRLSSDDRKLMLDALKTSAAQRTDGVLDAKRRRHYGHAASLVACCVELEQQQNNSAKSSMWAVGLRARTARFPAFQRELQTALRRVRRVTR